MHVTSTCGFNNERKQKNITSIRRQAASSRPPLLEKIAAGAKLCAPLATVVVAELEPFVSKQACSNSSSLMTRFVLRERRTDVDYLKRRSG